MNGVFHAGTEASDAVRDVETRVVVTRSERRPRLAGLRLWLVALPLVAVIAGFGAMGWNYIDHSRVFVGGGWEGSVVIAGHHIQGFNLDGEWNLPTAFSGLLILGAAVASFAVVRLGRARTGIPPVLIVPVSVLFAFMSLDEVWSVHERIEEATGQKWQYFYAPVFLAAGVAAVLLVRHLLRYPPSLWFLLTGGVVWFVAQMIDAWQWNDQDVLVHPYSIVPEETLEMLGSLLFLLAMLAILRGVARREAAVEEQRTIVVEAPGDLTA
jgi:hypothetical protein